MFAYCQTMFWKQINVNILACSLHLNKIDCKLKPFLLKIFVYRASSTLHRNGHRIFQQFRRTFLHYCERRTCKRHDKKYEPTEITAKQITKAHFQHKISLEPCRRPTAPPVLWSHIHNTVFTFARCGLFFTMPFCSGLFGLATCSCPALIVIASACFDKQLKGILCQRKIKINPILFQACSCSWRALNRI